MPGGAALPASGLLAFLDQSLHFLATLMAYLLEELVAILPGGHLAALLSAFLARLSNSHRTFLGHDDHLLSTDCPDSGDPDGWDYPMAKVTR